MKKLFLVILSAAMALSLAACGKTKTQVDVPQGEEFFKAVYEKTSEDMESLETTKVDLSGDLYYFTNATGLETTEGVEEVWVSEPMMSSVPYSFVYIKLGEKANTEDVKKAVAEGINPNKWICVSAEKTIVNSINSDIIVIMGYKDTADDVYESVKTLYGDALGEAIVEDYEY